MIKRPQSAAVTRTQYNAFKNEEPQNDINISTYSKFSHLRPTSGLSDKTQIKKREDYQNLFNQARYSLELNSFQDSITLFAKALTSAVSILTSLQFLDLFGQSIKILNDKAKQLIDNQTNPQIIITSLMQWTQLTQPSPQYDFLKYIKCPLYYQVLVLNSSAQMNIKNSKYQLSIAQLQQALDLLSSQEIEEPETQSLIGQTYLNISTAALYQSNYQEGIKYASTALTHLQTALMNNLDEDIAVMVSDAYINLAISKEKTKLFQEAHFNYYSALVNAQQNLTENRTMEIQDIYDKFLSRQAAFLQRYTMKPFKSNPSLVYSSTTSKPPAIPFIDVVKANKSTHLGLSQNKKKQKQYIKQQKMIQRKEQTQLLKFKPYKMKEMDMKSQKSFKITKQSNQNMSIPKPAVSQVSLKQNIHHDDIILSPIIKYLESILANKRLYDEHQVILLENFQEIRLSCENNMVGNYNNKSSLMVGQMSIYLLKLKNMLYLRYRGYEQNVIDQFSSEKQKYAKIRLNMKIVKIFGFMVTVSTQVISLMKFLTFLERIYPRNMQKQSLIIMKNQKTTQINIQDKCLQVQLKNEYESLVFIISDDIQKLKDDEIQLEPLVYNNQQSKQEEIQQDEDIKPLIAIEEDLENDKEMEQAAKLIQKKYRQKKHDGKPEPKQKKVQQQEDDDIQPLIANQKQIEQSKQESKSIIKRDAYQGRIDYDEAINIEENIEEDKELEDAVKKIQKSFKKKQQQKQNQQKGQTPSKRDGKNQSVDQNRKLQEKFTIKIESEDQKSKEIYEVYAEKQQQEPRVEETPLEEPVEMILDEDMEQAAKLIQKKFRLKKKFK